MNYALQPDGYRLFLSGGVLAAYGWDMVMWVSFVPLVLAVAALAMAMRRNAANAARQV